MSCDVGCRCGLDLAWLKLWQRPAAAALIQALAWELPYAMGAALKRQKRKKRKHGFWNPEDLGLNLGSILTYHSYHLGQVILLSVFGFLHL